MSAGAVVVYFSRLGGFMYAHEKVTLSVVAEAIAHIKRYEFAVMPRAIPVTYSSFRTIH